LRAAEPVIGNDDQNTLAEVEREMSTTLAEFARCVDSAFPGEVSGGPATFHVDTRAAAMTIALTPGRPRQLGAIELPTLSVRIRFTRGRAEDQAAMLAHMDRMMHRGGG
jgi:hypothetical protein